MSWRLRSRFSRSALSRLLVLKVLMALTALISSSSSARLQYGLPPKVPSPLKTVLAWLVRLGALLPQHGATGPPNASGSSAASDGVADFAAAAPVPARRFRETHQERKQAHRALLSSARRS